MLNVLYRHPPPTLGIGKASYIRPFLFLGPTIAGLTVTSIKQTEVTFTWRVIGSFDEQVSTFKSVGEEAQHKTLANSGESTFTETIRGLKPCKHYEITVTVFRGGLDFKKSVNVTTSPIGK